MEVRHDRDYPSRPDALEGEEAVTDREKELWRDVLLDANIVSVGIRSPNAERSVRRRRRF